MTRPPETRSNSRKYNSTWSKSHSLNEQLKQLEEHLGALANQEPVCQLLMSCPGIDPITALEYRAAIDDPHRFKYGDRVGSYLGLTPGENSSSLRKRRTSITKAGPSELRMLLCQAAWVYWRRHPDTSLSKWAYAIAERRGKKIAMVALMRKLAVMLWAM
ncbi:MAG: transposase [Myxococcota bacterium]